MQRYRHALLHTSLLDNSQSLVAVDTGREVFHMSAPIALILPQLQLEDAAIIEEVVGDPVLGPRLAVQLGALDVNWPIAGVEVYIANGCNLAGNGVGDAYFLEVRRSKEVNILSWNRPQTHHAQHHERAHSATVIVACDPGGGGVKLRRNVEVAIFGRKRGTSGIVELVNGQKGLLVTHVKQAWLVKEGQSFGERLCTSQRLD